MIAVAEIYDIKKTKHRRAVSFAGYEISGGAGQLYPQGYGLIGAPVHPFNKVCVMKLKSKFVLVGASLTIMVVVSAWLDYQSGILAGNQKTSVELIQRHMDADMKHDGIRGNVYSAMVGLKTGDEELLKGSRDDVQVMSAEFAKDTEENLAADIPADIKAQFEKIKGSVANYTGFSQKISQANDFDQAVAMLPEFNKVFDVLEEDQGKATDMILAWSAQVDESLQAMRMYTKIVLGIIFLLSIAVPVFAMQAIFSPLAAMVDAMTKLAQGDTGVAVPSAEREDEVGDMGRAVQVFKDNAQKIETMTGEQKQRFDAEQEKRRTIDAMVAKFDASAKTIADTVAKAASGLAKTAQGLVLTMGETKQTTEMAAEGSSQTSMNVQTVASASEELSASVREISSQLQKTSNLVNLSKEKAESADSLAKALTTASDKVAGAMDMIAAIAGQINLLALNATIESARAGDAGKGFAVVASEVKNLASQTDKSVGEIQAVIEEMRNASNAIINALNEIKNSVGSITEATASVAAAVEEQSATTSEIARTLQSAAAGTKTISDNLGNVSNCSTEAGEAAGQMLEATQELSKQAEELNTQVDVFLAKMKAA